MIRSLFDKIKLILVVAVMSCGGGGGGTGGADAACGELGIKIFGGDVCDGQRVNNPVVAVIAADAQDNVLALCTGALVTIDDVLTAAHCFEVPGLARVYVFVDGEIKSVSRRQTNPLYTGGTIDAFDTAMLTLVEPLNISPVPLIVSRNIATGDKISVYGYGQSEAGPVGPLRAAQMQIGLIEPGLFAASFDDTNTSICQGDSGGPVVETVNGVAGIVGITGFTVFGCQSGSASGFVDMQIRGNVDFVLGYAPDVALR